MVRTRRGPALFEVISKQSGGVRRQPRLGVPDWWRQQAASEGPEEERAQPQVKDLPAESVERRLREHEEEAAGGEPGPVVEAVRGRPSLGVRDGRICLTLTPIAGVVVVGTALLIVAGSFVVGRSLGWRDARRAAVAAGDDVAVVRQAEPDPSVLLGLATGVTRSGARQLGGGGAPGSGGEGLELGKTYLVIQTFDPSARADALRAQSFLATREVPTVLRQVSNGYLLVAREAFDWDDVQDRSKFESFRRSVVALGKLYASDKHRGGYDFKDCYPSTYRG
ncbi:MAG TPA: hypothetical protein VMZ31_18180 [Phycisphaerae bacterium]|nr:hypothetical protein [Phycisphaerae bacterium]